MEPVYNVVEFFESISGEVGTNIPQGERTWFLRFAGCSLQCAWCDSKHSWKEEDLLKHKQMTLSELIEDIEFAAPKNLIVTGGEPFDQPYIYNFFAALLQTEVENITVETGGVAIDLFFLLQTRDRISIVADYKPVSAEIKNEHNALAYSALRKGDLIKFPVKTPKDLTTAIKFWQFLHWDDNKPEFAFSPIAPMTAKDIFERLRSYPDSFRINGQLHKYLGLA